MKYVIPLHRTFLLSPSCRQCDHYDDECWVCNSNSNFSCSMHLSQEQLQKDQPLQQSQCPHHVKDMRNCLEGMVPMEMKKKIFKILQAWAVIYNRFLLCLLSLFQGSKTDTNTTLQSAYPPPESNKVKSHVPPLIQWAKHHLTPWSHSKINQQLLF